jgi:hypothetical protein
MPEDAKKLFELFKGVKDGMYIIDLCTAKRRTNPQNRYYHGLVVPMIKRAMEQEGNEFTTEETHEFLKARFNTVEMLNRETGEVITVPRSTARLTTVEFMDFIAKIQRFAAEWFGLDIPSPGEQMKMAV